MRSKRSVLNSVILFLLALPLLFMIAHPGETLYGVGFFGGVAAGLASGHLFLCSWHELSRQRLAGRWAIPARVGAIAVFLGPFPFIVLRQWAHASQGFVLGALTALALEMSFLSLLNVELSSNVPNPTPGKGKDVS